MAHKEDGIPFVVEVDTKGAKGIARAIVPLDTMKDNLHHAVGKLAEALESVQNVGDFRLHQVEVGVEVGAEGGVNFIGTTTISGSGSITLTFAPAKP